MLDYIVMQMRKTNRKKGSWDHCKSQEKLETMLIRNLGGQTKSIIILSVSGNCVNNFIALDFKNQLQLFGSQSIFPFTLGKDFKF